MYPGMVSESAKIPMVPGVGIVSLLSESWLSRSLMVIGPYVYYIARHPFGRRGIGSRRQVLHDKLQSKKPHELGLQRGPIRPICTARMVNYLSYLYSGRRLRTNSVIYKLFLRAFPNHFKANSVYAHYPMTIPRYADTALSNTPSIC